MDRLQIEKQILEEDIARFKAEIITANDIVTKKKKLNEIDITELDLQYIDKKEDLGYKKARLRLQIRGYEIQLENATDETQMETIRGRIQTKENVLCTLDPIQRAFPSPRLGNSVFVLLFDGEPIGTTFYVGNNKFITAAHCVLEDDGTVVVGQWSFVVKVTRTAGQNVFDSPPISVHVSDFNKDADWAVLSSVAPVVGLDPLEICLKNMIPPMREEPRFKLYHCPVSLYNSDVYHTLEACAKGWFRSMAIDKVNGILTLDYGGYRGSSGGVIVNQSGKAVAMHVESINETQTVEQSKLNSLNDLDAVSLSADSAASSHSSCSNCIILSHFPDLMNAIS